MNRDYRDHLKHVLTTTQPEFNRAFLNHFCDLTSAIRTKYGKKQSDLIEMKRWLAGKRAMLYFTQKSTRTFMSFVSACQNLGMDWIEVRDPNISSEGKGESKFDSLRTFSSFCDVIIMRDAASGLAVEVAAFLDATKRPVPVINGGSGTNHHPTQALLDIYTLDRTFRKAGRIDGKVIVLVGDLKRSRTIHSLCHLLRNYQDVKLRLVSPPELAMPEEIIAFLKEHRMCYEQTDDLDGAVDGADVIYLTRLQQEYGGVEGEIDYMRFALRPEHLNTPRKLAVLHPMPRGPELPPELDHDSRVLIWRQQRNGMWVRTALLFLILWRKNYDFLMVD
ncbi:MAG: aspartate carbamoyltransferase [Candidatus Uhrbacteria bacterium]|nr:aspartate carbamoyltransferase [Patescibacteria group bacterium]MBU1907416.1 aspartate carbamoyltransferase [Patescibacteria group bacterium]